MQRHHVLCMLSAKKNHYGSIHMHHGIMIALCLTSDICDSQTICTCYVLGSQPSLHLIATCYSVKILCKLTCPRIHGCMSNRLSMGTNGPVVHQLTHTVSTVVEFRSKVTETNYPLWHLHGLTCHGSAHTLCCTSLYNVMQQLQCQAGIDVLIQAAMHCQVLVTLLKGLHNLRDVNGPPSYLDILSTNDLRNR